MSKKIEVFCYVCSKCIGLKYKSNIRESQEFYCSKEHKSQRFSERFSGKNNPNYNKNWSKEKKEKQSILVSSKIDDEYRYKAGKANRGKKFSEERCEKISQGHKGLNPWKSLTKEQCIERKSKISEKSKLRETTEYRQNILLKSRITKIKNGTLISDEKRSDFDLYRKLSNWDKSLVLTNTQHDLINKSGMFNPIKNKNGLVRDHRYSRKDGFINGIYPELIRHPANLELLTLRENSKKKEKSSISIEVLFESIIKYGCSREEKELIDMYLSGNRWERKEASENG